MRGKLFIFSAPAGTGKTTLASMVLEEFPKSFTQAITCTTRNARRGEINGNHYHFLNRDEFAKKRDRGEFLEWAKVFDNEYGTLKKDIERELEAGKNVLLVIDTQGALQVKEKMEAVLLFIKPPSMEVLTSRLMGRATEGKQDIAKRLSWAEKEIAKASEYDYVIINDDLTLAYEELVDILQKETQCTNI